MKILASATLDDSVQDLLEMGRVGGGGKHAGEVVAEGALDEHVVRLLELLPLALLLAVVGGGVGRIQQLEHAAHEWHKHVVQQAEHSFFEAGGDLVGEGDELLDVLDAIRVREEEGESGGQDGEDGGAEDFDHAV